MKSEWGTRRQLKFALFSTQAVHRFELFYRRSNVAAHKRALHVGLASKLDVTHRLAFAFKYPVGVGKRSAPAEAQVHVAPGRRDVAEHVSHLGAKPKPDGGRMVSVHLFYRVRCLFEYDLTQGQRKSHDRVVVARKEIEDLGVGWTHHGQLF